MRQVGCTLGLSKQRILAGMTVAVLTSPTWADIKVQKLDPLSAEKERLKAAGWTGTFGANLPQFDLPDKATLQRTANQLVGSSADYLPKEIAAQVAMEMKNEIARVASEAFEQAILEEQSIIKMGQTGPLRYKVGVVRYAGNIYPSGYHKVSVVGGLAPFVALIPAGRARSMEAKITIHGMPAEAEIFFDGKPTTQRGSQRDYFTPPLEVGKIYEYEIVARWQEKGQEVKRSRQVTLTGGDAVRVDFYNHKRWINCKWKRYTGSDKGAKECSVAYSPDRKTVLRVVEKGDLNSDSLIRLFDAETGKPLGPKLAVGLGLRVTALAVAPDGKTVAAANGLRYQKDRILVTVWDATTGERVGLYDATNRGEVFDLSFFQNGKYVLITGLPEEGE
jgi:uncharacterized protein (TIGR03000 family)